VKNKSSLIEWLIFQILHFHAFQKSFRSGFKAKTAVKDLNLDIFENQITGILGKNKIATAFFFARRNISF
jgi:hypothetical protein